MSAKIGCPTSDVGSIGQDDIEGKLINQMYTALVLAVPTESVCELVARSADPGENVLAKRQLLAECAPPEPGLTFRLSKFGDAKFEVGSDILKIFNELDEDVAR